MQILPNIGARFKIARDILAEEKWIRSMQGGFHYEAHSVLINIEYDAEHGEPGIRPNLLGCWLIVLWWEITFRLSLVWFVLTSIKPEFMAWNDEDRGPVGIDTMRNEEWN